MCAQVFTDDCYAPTHQAQTDLQAFEDNFAALKSSFSGPTAPPNPIAGMIWADDSTSELTLRLRNKANNAYLTLPFISGTVMLFFQAAAPTGWTQVTTQNDKALRVVSGAGGGGGGASGLAAGAPTHTHTGPSHTHTGPSHTHTVPRDGWGNIIEDVPTGRLVTVPASIDRSVAANDNAATGVSGAAATGAAGTGATGSAGPWSPLYIDVILAQKN